MSPVRLEVLAGRTRIRYFYGLDVVFPRLSFPPVTAARDVPPGP